MSGLSLICSYPKSGNTWLRAVLAAAASEDGTVRLKDGLPIKVWAHRGCFDELMGVDASDLVLDEIEGARAAYCRALAEAPDMPHVWKVHDCFYPSQAVAPLPFPPEVLASVVYIVRDPRDVAVSFAHHFGKSIEEAIAAMQDESLRLARTGAALKPQLPQYISSWSTHVESWLDAPGIELHLMRYEDMITDPEKAFAGALRFLGVECSAEKLGRVLAATRFEVLQAGERKEGFKEQSPKTGGFFRRGIAGGWRDCLTEVQADRMATTHGRVMRRLGYLA